MNLVCRDCKNKIAPNAAKCIASGFMDGVKNGRKCGWRFAFWLVVCPSCGRKSVLQDMGGEIKAMEIDALPDHLRRAVDEELAKR